MQIANAVLIVTQYGPLQALGIPWVHTLLFPPEEITPTVHVCCIVYNRLMMATYVVVVRPSNLATLPLSHHLYQGCRIYLHLIAFIYEQPEIEPMENITFSWYTQAALPNQLQHWSWQKGSVGPYQHVHIRSSYHCSPPHSLENMYILNPYEHHIATMNCAESSISNHPISLIVMSTSTTASLIFVNSHRLIQCVNSIDVTSSTQPVQAILQFTSLEASWFTTPFWLREWEAEQWVRSQSPYTTFWLRLVKGGAVELDSSWMLMLYGKVCSEQV